MKVYEQRLRFSGTTLVSCTHHSMLILNCICFLYNIEVWLLM